MDEERPIDFAGRLAYIALARHPALAGQKDVADARCRLYRNPAGPAWFKLPNLGLPPPGTFIFTLRQCVLDEHIHSKRLFPWIVLSAISGGCLCPSSLGVNSSQPMRKPFKPHAAKAQSR